MRKLLAFLVLAISLQAAPSIGNYRWWALGPQLMYAGYTYVWQVVPAFYFTATCDSGLNNCYSADYTPTSSDRFVIDPNTAAPGGMQNQSLDFDFFPRYKAVNIGTGANAAGHWNPFQAVALNGATAVQVTITSTATVKFFFTAGYAPHTYMQQPLGWPGGTSFTYWQVTSLKITCESGSSITDPVGYTTWEPYGSNNTARCIEVTIPANATPGNYAAGWRYCLDTLGTGCYDLTLNIVVAAPPTMAYTPPASIPAMPAIYNTDTLCLSNIAAGTTQAGSNCKFTNIAGGDSSPTQHGASYWCQDRTNPDNTLELAGTPYYIAFSNVGGGTQNTGLGFYYDGQKAWYQTAKWFNDPKWENCGRAIGTRYSQHGPGVPGFAGILASTGQGFGNGLPSAIGPYHNNANLTGYWASLHSAAQMNNSFPKGFELALSRMNQGLYSSTWAPNSWNGQALQEIRAEIFYNAAGGFSANGAGYNVDDNRSTTYNWNGYLAFATTGWPKRNASGLTNFGWHYQHLADVMASILLMHVQQAATGPNDWGPFGDQTWEVGLQLESAIIYWQQTHEPRMAAIIKLVLDKLAAEYDYTAHALPYDDGAPYSIFCGGTPTKTDPTTKWYSGSDQVNCQQALYPEMNQMLAFAYAWYWKYWGGAGGGDAYRAFADELFTYALIGDQNATANRYTPKAYYQSARYWFHYLAYRLGYANTQ